MRPRPRFPPLSLRGRILLVLLLGAVLPLGIVGAWLVRSTERAGERLLRERLDRTLVQIATEVGLRWVRIRSSLLSVAEHPAGRAAPDPAIIRVALIRSPGDTAFAFEAPGGRSPAATGSLFPVRLPVHHPAGNVLGVLEADVMSAALVPEAAGWGVGGAVLGIFDRASGASLLPLAIEPEVIRQPRFRWTEEPWIGVQRRLDEPSLDLVLAAPLGPIAGPFAAATRQGTIALLAVSLGAILLATVLSGRLTRSLKQLADGAVAVAEGDLDRTVAVGAGDEVGRVARAFNQMTESLRRTLAELAQRESLAAVGTFASQLAHEVRNPLTGIRLDLQGAEERVSDPVALELLSRTLRSVARLDATVTGALRVARSGRVEPRPVELREPLEAALETASPQFQGCGATLEPLPAQAGECTIHGDPAALEQLFLNLLLNAARAAGARGRAGIRCELGERDVAVSVWDTGPGIPPEERDRVLEPFYSTSADGTGLGLAIARQIAVAHGGTIAIENGRPAGAVVRVTLPLAAAAKSPA